MEEIKQKIDDYLKKAEPLFRDIEIQIPSDIDIEKISVEFKQMAMAYYNDAKHFYEVGEYANALAALEYAEGWLDAGKRLGIFK